MFFALPLQHKFCIFASVKFITFILAVYVLALNFAPCEDSSAFDNSSNTEIVQLQDLDHDHNASDLCSPFCHCQCCQVHVAEFNIIKFATFTTEIPSEVFFHIDNLGKDIPNSILQPPRV